VTITHVQSATEVVDASTSDTLAFGGNVTAGNLITVRVFAYAGGDSTALVAGSVTKSAGTATIGAVTLDRGTGAFEYDSGVYVQAAVFSCLVTGTGSLTMQISSNALLYFVWAISEYSTDVGWDASRVEAVNSATSATDGNATASSGNGASAGAALFEGVVAIPSSSGGADLVITEDGAFTLVVEETDHSAHMTGSVIRRIVSSATTDAAEWAYTSGAAHGNAAALVVYKEAGGAPALRRKGSLGLLGVGR
jgi:hypothetical protein